MGLIYNFDNFSTIVLSSTYLNSIDCPFFFLSDSLSILYSIADCFCAITFKSWTSLCWSKLTPGKVLMLCNAFWASRAAFRVKNVTKQQPKERKKKELVFIYFLYFFLNKEKMIIIQAFPQFVIFILGKIFCDYELEIFFPK